MKTKRMLALEARQAEIKARLEAKDDEVIERGSDLNDDERTAYEADEAELSEVTSDLNRLIKREAEINESIALGAKLGVGGQIHRAAVHVAGSDGNDPAVLKQFFTNLLNAKINNDPEAQAAIARSNEEQREILRAVDTAALPGTIIPQYEKAVSVPVEAGRNFLNTLNRRNVTSEVVHVPTVDDEPIEPEFQATQNTAFEEVNYGTTDATYVTRTLGAFCDVSVQALDFSSVSPTDILNELQRGYNRRVEFEAVNGTADSATHLLGIAQTPAVIAGAIDGSAVATGEELWALLGEAFGNMGDDMLSDDEQPHVLMSRRVWTQMRFSLTEKHPLLGLGYGTSQLGNVSTYDVGDFKVVVSNNVKLANGNDQALVYLPSKVWFYEANGGRLTTITDVISQAYKGTVRLVARNYVNFPGVRPNPGAAVLITGLDLAAAAGEGS
jgi:hypothetical protein